MLALIKRLYLDRLGYVLKGFIVGLIGFNLLLVGLFIANQGNVNSQEMMETVFGLGILVTVISSLLLVFWQNIVWITTRFRLIPLKEWRLCLSNVIATFLLVVSNIILFYLLLGIEQTGISLLSGNSSESLAWFITKFSTAPWFYLGLIYVILFVILGGFLLFLIPYVISQSYVSPKSQKFAMVVLVIALYKFYNWVSRKPYVSFEFSNPVKTVSVGLLILAIMMGLSVFLVSRVEARGNQDKF